MANQPIPVSKATALMQEYVSYMTGLGVNMNQQTQTVSFNANDLRQWIDGAIAHSDEFRFCLGVYPPTDANAGRITVAIWPYKNGQPASDRGVELEPFNMGSLEP